MRSQFVPDPPTTAVPGQLVVSDRVSEVDLQGVSADASQLDRLAYGDEPVFTGKLNDSQ